MLVLAVSLALGILLERSQRIGVATPLVLAALCLLAGPILLQKNWNRTALACLLAGFVCAGAASQVLFRFRFPANHISHLSQWGFDLEQPVNVEGYVATELVHTPTGFEFDAMLSEIDQGGHVHPATGKLRMRARSAEQFHIARGAWNLRYGDPVRASVRLWRPRTYRNPGSFDYRWWMESIEDVYWQASVRNIQNVSNSHIPRPRRYALWMHAMRRRLIEGIDRMFPPWSTNARDGAVLKAILLGERASLDSVTIEHFRVSGLYHLLVVAGLHVGLLAALLAGLLRLFRIRETWRFIVLLAFLAFYAGLVEQRAPTLRATLMIGSYLVAGFLYREHSALNAVGFAAFLLLVARPTWIFESGFQLSFTAALLIVGLAVPILQRTTEPYRKALWGLNDLGRDTEVAPRQAQFRLDVRELIASLKRTVGLLEIYPSLVGSLVMNVIRGGIWLIDILVFSAVLQFGLMLPMAQIFHRVTLAGIGLNALAVPLMTLLLAVAVPCVLLYTMFPWMPTLPSRLVALLMHGLFAMTEVPHLPAWLSFRVPNPPLWVACGFVLALIACGLALGRHRRIFGISAASALFLGVLIAVHPFPPDLPQGSLQITALDCDGCETYLIVLPDRTTILVGAGGSTQSRITHGDPFRPRRWDPGENIVSPYLWSLGLDRLDVLLIADPAGDRLDGVATVLKNFRVGEFWYGSLPAGELSTALWKLLRERRVGSRLLSAGDRIAERTASLRVLWPPATASDDESTDIDSAVVLRIVTGSGTVFLPGDLSRASQRHLADAAGSLKSVLMALPNRGNVDCCDPALIDRVSAQVALVSGVGGTSGSVGPAKAGDRSTSGPTLLLKTSRLGAVTVQIRPGRLSYHGYRRRPVMVRF
jgi:competence protein ComEC